MARTLVLADVADSRSNNFRIVRHLAAASVIVAHSFGLLTPAALSWHFIEAPALRFKDRFRTGRRNPL